MTKTRSWICDICKKEFHKDDSGYSANIGFDIYIPGGSEYESEKRYVFEDTCIKCRENLIEAIEGLVVDLL